MHSSDSSLSRKSLDFWIVPILLLITLLCYGRLLLGDMVFGSDTFRYNLGQKFLMRDQLLSFSLPVIDPYILAGAPLLENIQAGAMNPLNLLLVCGSPLWGFHLFIVGHYALAVLTFYVLLRQGLALPRWPSATGAIGYAAGGYMWSMADHFFFMVAPWAPLFFLALLCICREPRKLVRSNVAIGALSLAAMLYCGNFQQAYDAAILGALIVAPELLRHVRAREWHRLRDLIVPLAVVAAAGVLIAAPQLLPTLAAVSRSHRAGGLPLPQASEWSFHPARMVEYVFPFIFGAAQDLGTAVAGFYKCKFAWSRSVFVGIPLLVGALSLRHSRSSNERRCMRWALTMLIVGLVLAFGRFLPVYRLLHAALPGFSLFRHPEKYLYWAHFALGLLGALGLAQMNDNDTVRRASSVCRLLAMLSVAACGVLVAAFVFVRPTYLALIEQFGSFWTVERFFRWQLSQCAGVAAAALVMLLWILGHRQEAVGVRRPMRVAFLLTVVHLLAVSYTAKWTTRARNLDGIEVAASFMPDDHSMYRVYSDETNLSPVRGSILLDEPYVAGKLAFYARLTINASSIFRRRTIGGFSPLLYREYISLTDFTQHHPQSIMDLLCVKYLIVSDKCRVQDLPPGNTLIKRVPSAGYALLENAYALPRIYATNQHLVVPGNQVLDKVFEIAAARRSTVSDIKNVVHAPAKSVGKEDLAPHTRAPSERLPPVVISQLPPHYASSVATGLAPVPEIVQDSPGHIILNCQGPTWLVVRDRHLPGWDATLNGTAGIEVTKADGAFLSVFVPPGEHRIDFRYRPPGLKAGCLCACLGFLLLSLTCRRPRQRAVSASL